MTTCKCSRPPGGGGRCGKNQIAICRSGKYGCDVTCSDLPRAVYEALKNGDTPEVLAWISTLVGSQYSHERQVRWNSGTLRSGTMSASAGGPIKFELPRIT